MAGRKSEGAVMSAELVQTLAEALRASSQAQQTMAEAMLALAGKPGPVARRRGMDLADGGSGGGGFPHKGALTLQGETLMFVEDPPGNMVESVASLAGREKKIRMQQVELDLAAMIGVEATDIQVQLVTSALNLFVRSQQGFKILCDAQCPQLNVQAGSDG